MSPIDKLLRFGESKALARYEKIVPRINALEEEMMLLEDDEFIDLAQEISSRKYDSALAASPESFALVREAARRTIGQRHYDVQLLGGLVLLDGNIAEMKTGEGKTLTSTLAAATRALLGEKVHLVTVNDYLAKRDAEWMAPIYQKLGFRVAALQAEDENPERREKYGADIVYGTASEFAFDYLRDNMAVRAEDFLQAQRDFALVDEIDNILIDEARTPLIISGSEEKEGEIYEIFAALAQELVGVESRIKLKSQGESRDTSGADYDYEYDEKHKTVSPTEHGVALAEKFLGIEHLYLAEHGTLVNHLQQALKAKSLYIKDKDYAVIDGRVQIIDEHTGRILEGRRWSEGLHQAIEAKEGIEPEAENQTLASTTLQNYFRLYPTLSGMTGTALTEAREFKHTYKIDVFEIPTHRPSLRVDEPDRIYGDIPSKWSAVVEEIERCHKKRQPVLVGTVSIEDSEGLSQELSQRAVRHVLLNAKPENAQQEGEIVAEAGRLGAVTIATNMAGRGVDIQLGGSPEFLSRQKLASEGIDLEDSLYLEKLQEHEEEFRRLCAQEAEEVRSLGGLRIIGTERHESRRIDNQLRGRSGRQGDPGSSVFMLSAQDRLVRLFAGDRVEKIFQKLSPSQEAISSKMLSKAVASAQEKVEEQNFLSRKRVLEYDDVLQEQRRVIYQYRQDILHNKEIQETGEQIDRFIRRTVEEYMPGDLEEEWDRPGLREKLRELEARRIFLPEELPTEKEETVELLQEKIHAQYLEIEAEAGPELMRNLERTLLLYVIDERWREHLRDIDYMREGIHLRGFAQIDPLVAYKNEAYSMFSELIDSIWDEWITLAFRADAELLPGAEEILPPEVLPGRNEPCWCGSGKKYKKCHGQ